MQSWIEDAIASLTSEHSNLPPSERLNSAAPNPEFFPWLTHRFATFKKDPAVFGRLGSELTRVVVEKYGPDVGEFKNKVGENTELSEDKRTEIYADLNAMGAAYDFLQRYRELVRYEFRQGTIPFPAPSQTEMPLPAFNPLLPPSPAPVMGPEAELGLKEEVGDLAITDQTETTTTEPGTESSETEEASAELHEWEAGIVQINSDLLDPLSIQNAKTFLAVFERTQSVLDHIRDPWQARRVEDMAEKLQALSKLLDLGLDYEIKGRVMRFDALYKASQLSDPPPRGRRRVENNGSDPLQPFSPNSQKVITMLRRLEPQNYRKLRDEAIKLGTLSEKTFRASTTPKTPKESETSSFDPRRYLFDFGADFRTNPSSYTVEQARALAEDPRSLENFGPVAERCIDFWIAFMGSVRTKVAEAEAAELIRGPSAN